MGYRSYGMLIYPEEYLKEYVKQCPNTPVEEWDEHGETSILDYSRHEIGKTPITSQKQQEEIIKRYPKMQQMSFSSWKWYEGYEDVLQIENFMAWLDDNEIPWAFVRQGEDAADQEIRGGYDGGLFQEAISTMCLLLTPAGEREVWSKGATAFIFPNTKVPDGAQLISTIDYFTDIQKKATPETGSLLGPPEKIKLSFEKEYPDGWFILEESSSLAHRSERDVIDKFAAWLEAKEIPFGGLTVDGCDTEPTWGEPYDFEMYVSGHWDFSGPNRNKRYGSINVRYPGVRLR